MIQSCPECFADVKVPAAAVGKKIRCKTCRAVFRAGEEEFDDAAPGRAAAFAAPAATPDRLPPRRSRGDSSPRRPDRTPDRREPAGRSTALPPPKRSRRSAGGAGGGIAAAAGGVGGTLLIVLLIGARVWAKYERHQRRHDDRAAAARNQEEAWNPVLRDGVLHDGTASNPPDQPANPGFARPEFADDRSILVPDPVPGPEFTGGHDWSGVQTPTTGEVRFPDSGVHEMDFGRHGFSQPPSFGPPSGFGQPSGFGPPRGFTPPSGPGF